MQLRMLTAVMVMCVLATGAAGQDAGKKADKSDDEVFQGTWSIASLETMGVVTDDEDIKAATVSFAAGSVTVRFGGKDMALSYKLDPSKKPKQIDIIEPGNGKDQVHQGIYKVEGDTITICIAHANGTRPTEFTTNGSIDKLLVLKRAKK